MIQALNGLRPFALPWLVARGKGSAPIWTPAANFPLGTEPGLWYDPSTFTGLYQDSAGTSPATAVGQPNGLVLDKRKAIGPELIAGAAVAYNSNCTVSTTEDVISITCTVAGVFGAKVPLSSVSNISRYQAKATILSTPGRGTYFSVSGSADYQFGSGAGAKSWFASVPTAGVAGFLNLVFAGGQVGDIITLSASSLSVKEAPGNHISQATASARPIIGAAGAIQYTTYDGLDDGMSTGAVTLGSDMDCFIAVKRTSATGILLYTTAGSGVYLGALDATAGAASAGAGTPTYAVNGVDVAGGTGTTRTQLAAAIPIGLWVVLEIRNANLSAWATLAMGAYTGFPMGMDFAQGIVCPAGDAATRTKNRQFAGAKAGLSL